MTRTWYHYWYINIVICEAYTHFSSSSSTRHNSFNRRIILCVAGTCDSRSIEISRRSTPQSNHMATPKVNRQLTIITPPHRTRDTRLTCPEKFKIRYSHHLQNCGSWFEADLLVWLSKIDEWIDNGAIDEIKSDASRLASEQRFAPAIKQLDVDEQGNRFECHLICWPNCSLWQKPVRWSLWLALASTGRSCSCRLLCRHCGCPLL